MIMEIEKTKTGLMTLKCNGKYIHSKYDPLREAEQFAAGNEELLNNSIIAVYGLGLGYHVQSLAKRIDSHCKIYVFEWNKNLIRHCKKINPEVFEIKNIKIITCEDSDFYNKFSKVIGQFKNLIVHKPSLETIKNSNEILYNLINDFALTKLSIEKNGDIEKESEENLKENIKGNYKDINEFIEKYKNNNKPFVIAAAGPSLDDELILLKENRNKFNVLCVGSSFRTLINNGIEADAVVIIDTKEIVKRQFLGLENEKVPLCFAAESSRWAVQIYNGPKYIFNVNINDDSAIRTGGTVAIAAISIALKCKAKEIIFLGQDLAFRGDKSHTSTFEKTYGFKDDYIRNFKCKTVKGVSGNMVQTNQGYITFKNRIESLIRSNKKVSFINCSKGAFINGAKHDEFKNIIKNY